MVLAYTGRNLSEAALAEQLKTRDFGTPLSNALRLKQWRLVVEVGSITENRLKTEMLEGRPVIARVWTAMLNYWEVETSHVVVVVGFDDWGVYVNDPAADTWPIRISWDGFLAAWFEFNQTVVIIR
jgi:uncharacterized protein YvpB